MMTEIELQAKQLEFQKDGVKILEEKLEKSSPYKSKLNQENILKKIYLKPIASEIEEIKKENLRTVIYRLIVQNRGFIEEIKKSLDEFKDWEDFERLEKSIKKNNIKDYLIEDIAVYLSSQLIEQIENKKIYYKKETIFYKLYEFLLEFLEDTNKTIVEYKLQQKQALALWTLPLTSLEIAYSAFLSLMILKDSKEKSEDDKINLASKQQLIKTISENLQDTIYNHIQKDFLKNIEELDNNHMFEIVSEVFILFEEFNVIAEIDKSQTQENRFDTYELSKQFQKECKDDISLAMKYASPFFEPMVVSPIEWKSVDDGGYLHGDNCSSKYKLLIQKTKIKKEKKDLLAQATTISKDFLKAINILQSTKWQVNKKVFEVSREYVQEHIKEIEIHLKNRKKETKQESKKIQKEIDALRKDIQSITEKYAIRFEERKKTTQEFITDEEEYQKSIKKSQQKLKEEKATESKELIDKLHSLYELKRNLTKKEEEEKNKLSNYKKIIDIAKKYKDFENIYFTWQVDFRGRIYPVQALLNPQGEDIAKALLTFSEKKSLGEDGLFWLKVHGANCYGIDKVSFKERIQWVDEHQAQIQTIAVSKKPFEEDFLKTSDAPFKFLAFCYEYNDYLNNPKEFKSSLPIAIDGSNNGFQHIATLLRDTNGAKKVNVLPSDENKPADIYNDVALELKKIIRTHYDKLDKDFIEDFELIETKINRSFVKKGVMTDSYGAGVATKAQQIKEYLKKEELDKKLKTPLDTFSKLTAKYLDKAIDTVAPSSAKYKKWINHLGKIISSQGEPIIWHTPFINFKVIQQEYESKKDRIVTTIKDTHGKKKQNSVQIEIFTDKIDKKAQAQGIAPNFIHSLDATHLYLTILSSYEKNIDSFATVHDSFATHACHVETLSITLKEEFIKLAKYDVLQNLQDAVSQNYGLIVVDKVKDKKREIANIQNLYVNSDFNIDLIRNSKYFFA